MTSKDKDPILKESGVIYKFKCNRVECDEEYIGESGRNFGERFNEHLKVPSPIYDHFNICSHTVTIDNFSILGREDQNLIRTFKEALYIRANNPSLNRNVGKFHLPHIWDEGLLYIMLTSGNSICHYGFNICQIIPTLGGYSFCHHGNNICQHYIHLFCVFFHLPHK